MYKADAVDAVLRDHGGVAGWRDRLRKRAHDPKRHLLDDYFDCAAQDREWARRTRWRAEDASTRSCRAHESCYRLASLREEALLRAKARRAHVGDSS